MRERRQLSAGFDFSPQHTSGCTLKGSSPVGRTRSSATKGAHTAQYVTTKPPKMPPMTSGVGATVWRSCSHPLCSQAASTLAHALGSVKRMHTNPAKAMPLTPNDERELMRLCALLYQAVVTPSAAHSSGYVDNAFLRRALPWAAAALAAGAVTLDVQCIQKAKRAAVQARATVRYAVAADVSIVNRLKATTPPTMVLMEEMVLMAGVAPGTTSNIIMCNHKSKHLSS
jgi:hypothetical protein